MSPIQDQDRSLTECFDDEDRSTFLEDGEAQPQQRRRLWAAKGGALMSALALLAVGVWMCNRNGAGPGREDAMQASLELHAVPAGAACRTAVEGERCFHDVHWAMTEGILAQPKWYAERCPDLRPMSDIEEFQTCVHKISVASCPSLPCKAGSTSVTKPPTKPRPTKPPPSAQDNKDSSTCHTALHGEPCYLAVMRVRADGPATGLSFEAVQEHLHRTDSKLCPRPCQCQAALPGSLCFKHVQWALKGGLRQHSDWYNGLEVHASFSEIQEYLHGMNSCPKPCHVHPVHDSAERPLAHVASRDHRSNDRGDRRYGSCRTANPTELCYSNVLYGMQTGRFEHPDWYPGLDELSSFEDFQDVLHRNPDLQCPKPCACRSAQFEDDCYKKIRWVLREDIKKRPGRYPGVNATSRWEVVQARLHKDADSTCDFPCSPKVWDSPSLFCFAVIRSSGYELDLVKSQAQKGAGLFSCDEYAVLSDTELEVTAAVKALIIPPNKNAGVTKDGTAANAQIFMQAWKVIFDDVRYRAHDWVIKVDPDAVVIVDRLRDHLAKHTGQKVFLQNCAKYQGPGWPTMFGSLEAFSHLAIEAYFAHKDQCLHELKWHAWGEDLFMNSCMELLGVRPVYDSKLISDNVCKGVNCADGISASYHPFKSPEAWFECYGQVNGVTYFRK